VQVPVTVTNEQHRYVTGLRKEDFQLWEDKIEQKIEYFYTEDAPMSLGIILDTSTSMNPTIRDASRNVGECLKASDLSDEFFLVLFATRAQPATEFTTDIRPLQSMILFLKAKGSGSMTPSTMAKEESRRRESRKPW
jgi:Ca-activated chloride channel family protein